MGGFLNYWLLQGEFILVLDCDMLAHPDLLLRVLGHFYEHNGKAWIKKEKAAFVQTPQASTSD